MTLPVRHHRAYGLCIRSEIEVPFAAEAPRGKPDLTIRTAAALPALEESSHGRGGWRFAPDRVLLDVDGVARYLVRNRGREIVVAPSNGTDDQVGAFLCGPVLGACLQQRGYLTLHASAVETEAGAVLFAGPRGIGKSTLLAALLDRGYRMLADDVSAIVVRAGGRPEVLGAFPHVRLWADVLDRLRWNGQARALAEVRGARRKWWLPVERFREAPLAVRAVCVLSAHDRDSIEMRPAPVSTAFASLVRHTYRPRLVRALGLERPRFRMVEAVVRRARVVLVRRPPEAFRLDALADRIVEFLEETPDTRGWPASPSESPRPSAPIGR
ncbi:MAG: hypothetical protein F4130_12680 [Acidobacteria bacterium]|nr:hypothetical protein [Acidobacteriota bacterium]MYH23128.1 hypothetical protein [Acidobacteriota bacterium]